LREGRKASQATFQGQAEATQKMLARVRGERTRAAAEVQRLSALAKEQEGLRQERDRLGGELAEARAAGGQAAARLQAEARAAEELRPPLQALQRSLEEAAAGRGRAREARAGRRHLVD